MRWNIRQAARIVALLPMVVAAVAQADSIRLYRSASVPSGDVRLIDIAAIEGEDAEAFAAVVVATASQSKVTQDELRRTLAKAGANWAKVSLKGYETCDIQRGNGGATDADAKTEGPGAAIDAPRAPVISNPTEPVIGDAALTLEQRLTRWIHEMHGEGAADLRITFAERDEKELKATVGSDKLVFTSHAAAALGRVPVTIQRFRGDRLATTLRITAEVRRRQLVVVAIRPVAKGEVVTQGDIEIREMYLDRDADKGLTRLDDAIGQVAAASIREGAVVTSDAVRSAWLVRRNEMIRVQAVAGALVIHTVARALEDGAEGQIIQVRNERSRETFTARVIGSRQVVLLADAPLSASKTPANSGKTNNH